MSDGERLPWVRLKRLLVFLAGFVAAVVFLGIVYNSLLVPLLISAFLAYLLLPLVGRLERWRLPRWLAALLLVVGTLTVITLASVRLVPLLYHQAVLLIGLIPGAMNTLALTWIPGVERYVSGLGLASPESIHETLAVGNVVSRVASQMQGSLIGLWKTGASLAGGMVSVVLIPVLTFFLLKDYPSLAKALGSLVPPDLEQPVHRLLAKVDKTLRSVLKGQATIAAILAVLYVASLTAIGLQSSVAIGVVAGICRVIPYLDVAVGGTLAALVLLSSFTGWGQVLSVVLVFLGVQAVDGAVITPAVIGDRVGLHPLVVILSVMAFGDWLGFWGVLLAIPVAAVAKALLEAALVYYRQSRLFMPKKRPEAELAVISVELPLER